MKDFLDSLTESKNDINDLNDVNLSPEDENSSIEEPGQAKQTLAFGWEIIKVIVISVIIIIPIRYFVVQPFFVKGASMENTFFDDDYILIDEISYRFKEPERGNVIVFKFPNDEKQFFIKRLIGLPGETVLIKNSVVTIFNEANPQGMVLDENSYLSDDTVTLPDLRKPLNEGEFFVMGDNRTRSSDSRTWGAVERSQITGRVFARAWPFGSAEFFDQPKY